jgi:hypothetical protein
MVLALNSRLRALFYLLVKPRFFRKQLFFRFHVVGIRNAAINRAHCSTLRLFMKAAAFGTLSGNDIIKFIGNRRLGRFAFNR